jgi:hypothetical protein
MAYRQAVTSGRSSVNRYPTIAANCCVILSAIIGSRRLLGWSLVAGLAAVLVLLFADDDEQRGATATRSTDFGAEPPRAP